jgi:hypothetical protein
VILRSHFQSVKSMIRISLHPCVPSSYHRMRFRTTPNQFSRGCQWKLRRAQSLLCSSQPNYKQRWVQTTLDTLVILSLSRWYWKRVMNNQHRSSIPNLFRWAWCTAARLVCRQEVAQIGLNGLTASLNQKWKRTCTWSKGKSRSWQVHLAFKWILLLS